MATDEKTKKWREEQVYEKMMELTNEGKGYSFLLCLAEVRVRQRLRKKFYSLGKHRPSRRPYGVLVDAEYERLCNEAEQALVIEYGHCSPH
jgi:hypothetical protein